MGKGDRRISVKTEARCLGSGMNLGLTHKTEKNRNVYSQAKRN